MDGQSYLILPLRKVFHPRFSFYSICFSVVRDIPRGGFTSFIKCVYGSVEFFASEEKYNLEIIMKYFLYISGERGWYF